MKRVLSSFLRRTAVLFLLLAMTASGRGEAMLQLFNVNWDELRQKMPEIAEAGYTSLWLPPPAKAGSVFSVGYDLFDPFDLGDKNQRGTIRTKYGTKAELQRAVDEAHRFGLRVYFDNIMNHRGFDVPGFNSNTPTNLYPGLAPRDFHLRTQPDGTFRNWDSISDFNNVFQVLNRPLFGLIDLSTEPGINNINFGATEGSVAAKISFVRQPGNPEYYMDTNLPPIAGPWRPFNGANGDPVAEDVNAHLIRAAMWMLNETKVDGFRFDAVKHTPSAFFGNTSDTPDGYTGGIQAIFDQVHGYGNNLLGNGYVEGGGNRDSVFDTEVTRNDAMLFGEHLGEPPAFQDYIDRGMRLLGSPLHFHLNSVLGNPGASLTGLDQRDFRPFPSAFRGVESVLFAQSHDDAVAIRRELHNAYNFMREGLPSIYSDGYNKSPSNPGEQPFPRHANAPYLGQFGDNKMPDLAWLHHQLARGGTRARWSDSDIVAFERYDYREGSGSEPQHQAVALFVMNDNFAGTPAGEISFDDGVTQTSAGTFYECFPVQNSRGVGLVVGFPPGSVLVQLADSPNKNRACSRLLVRQATQSLTDAQNSANDPNPANRKVYVGSQSLAPGGGAIELKVPSGGYVIYAYQWPEASRAGQRDAITFRQNGQEAARITVLRKDGVDGDPNFSPNYPFKMRGSVDQFGNLIPGVNVSNRTYAIDIPILTNAPFDMVIRTDASASNVLVKMDGGLDLNSHLGYGPTTGIERRDNRPGAVTDVFLGYEQTTNLFRSGPEKFGSANTNNNTVVSPGAETYHYTVGGGMLVVTGSGGGLGVTNQTATWAHHDPTNGATVAGGPATQRNPLLPGVNQPVDIWIRAGFQFEINKCYIYYTTDGSNPEGAFGEGRGTTRVVGASFAGDDTLNGAIDWWKGTIPASNHVNGAQIRYKVALLKEGINPISDASTDKVYGLNEAAIPHFDPTSVTVWLHNNRNTNHTVTGLQEGFHIVRARAFLPRAGKSSVYNTFLQTFYYDAQPPDGVIGFPSPDGATITNTSDTVVIRADDTTTGVEVNIQDSNPNNDDTATGLSNGNGLSNGVPVFAQAMPVSADPALSLLHPGLPREYRFNYAAVPSSGTATITVRLKENSTEILTNRFTTLTRTVNTSAPDQTLFVSNPAADGMALNLQTNEIVTLLACITQTVTNSNNIDFFTININGIFQPRRAPNGTPLYRLGGTFCGPGFRSLRYDWSGMPAGTNTIEIIFNGDVVLSDTRVVNVVFPLDPNTDSDGDGMSDYAEQIAGTDPNDENSVLRITELGDGNRLVVWDSVPGKVYRVLATTDLNVPLTPISGLIQASSATTFYFDSGDPSDHKFYRIEVVPQ